jgi:glucosamine-6-phosphate deaminase
MSWHPPDYLQVPSDQLGRGCPVKVRIGGDQHDVAVKLAHAILREIVEAQQAHRAATLILPVGPVDQFPILASLINEQRVDCRDVALINMDEYLDDDDRWVPIDHPLSFRGFMNRKFYDQLDPMLAPRPENRIFPDPQNPGAIARLIAARGGIDCCFGGIGINGHIAFNEPPEPDETLTVEQFAALATRALSLARETRTINSVTVGGDITIIPRRAVTVGMLEILASRRVRFCCNRPWQRAVVRRVLHGPITPACPASLLRLHADAELTIADYVAELPDIQLR